MTRAITHIKIRVVIVLFLAFLTFIASIFISYAQVGQKRQILVIHSYHRGYKWTDEIMEGIEAAFNNRDDIDLWVEYMDTKRLFDEEYIHRLYEVYEYKFASQDFDVIISSDDNAFNFLVDYRDELFPDTPVVFCGVNFFEDSALAGRELFTGVSEDADVREGIDIALKLHPNTAHIAVVNDTTTTGLKMHERLVKIMPDYRDAVDFLLLEDMDMAEIQDELRALPSDSIVFYTVFFRDKSGEFFEFDESISMIAAASSVPVYVTWDFSLGYGTMGGMLTSGFQQGETAGELAARILDGEDVANIPVVRESPNRYMFDYEQVQRFGVKRSDLPEGSIVINEPVSFYSENKGVVWGVAVGFGVMALIVFALLVNTLGRRRAEAELAESNRELLDIRDSLEQRVAERTRDLEHRSTQLAERTRDLELRSSHLEAAAQVARNAAAIRDVQELLNTTVRLISDQFGFYHASIFMVDDIKQYAVLQAASSEGGKRMLERGYKREVGGDGVVGYVTGAGEPRIAFDIGEGAINFDNPDLPETRSEMAVPLKMRDRVIGALDVQSVEAKAFTTEDVRILQTLADQVALAIDNARLLQESEHSLAEAQRVQRRLTREAWDGYITERERGV